MIIKGAPSGKDAGGVESMNKKNMGKFLKELRNANKYTMNNLIAKLDSENLTVTTKTIVDWEKGNTVPELEKLVFLARLYKVTVDEILDGERFLTKEDLFKKYPLYSKEFKEIKDNKVFFDKRTEYIEIVNKRFKQLIKKVYESGLTHNEKVEFDFLFKHKCKLSEFCEERSNDEFINFYGELKDLKANPKITSFDEFWWEAQKLFDNSSDYPTSIWFGAITDEEIFEENHFVKYLIDHAEPWEMDMLVAGLQNFDPIVMDADSHSNHLRWYKERHGKEFNREEIFKSTLKFLLNHGGMLNPYFYNFYEKKIRKIKVIDRLEELYKLCLRPIEVYTIDDERQGFQKRSFIENTKFNRFLSQYHSFLFSITHERNVEELNPKALYELVIGDDNEDRIVKLLCKYKNIDTNRDKSYVLADLSWDLKFWREKKCEFIKKEEDISKGLKEIKKLEALLNKKQEFFEESYIEEVGPKQVGELYGYIKYWKRPISLVEFNNERDKDLSEQLLKEIDKLTVQEIREKFFFKETQEGGADND